MQNCEQLFCFPLVLRICRSVRSVIDSYNSSILGIWDIWINSLPYIQSSITITLPCTDRTAVIMRFSCHNTIHKHAHVCAIYTFIHKVSCKSVLTSYVVSSFIQTPLFCLGRLDIWMCLISALHRPYSELTSSFFFHSTRASECAWSHKVVLMSNGRCSRLGVMSGSSASES